MYIGRGMYQKKMTRSEKWGIVKKVAYVTMATSFVALSVIGSLGVRHVKSAENKIRDLAEENGYVESYNMDEFMKTSENVSKEEYAEYSKLKEEHQSLKSKYAAGTIGAGLAIVGGAAVVFVADKKEDEMFPIY